MLFISSSAFVDPRSWLSIHQVVETYNDGFTAHISLVKVGYYALVSLILIAILNQPSVKKAIKNVSVAGFNKIKVLPNVIKTILN